MQDFGTDREALDFLVGKIAAEAERENVPLSEIERKMLYFSETDWTMPDMAAVSAEFDRNYDQDEYEQKIAGLVSKITAHGHGHNQEEQEIWDAAVDRLSKGDHYLLVMIGAAHSAGSGLLPTLGSPTVRPPHDVLKLWLTAFGIVFGFLGLWGLLNWLFGPRAADWVFDRNRIGVFVLVVVLAWILAPKIRGVFRTMLNLK